MTRQYPDIIDKIDDLEPWIAERIREDQAVTPEVMGWLRARLAEGKRVDWGSDGPHGTGRTVFLVLPGLMEAAHG